MCWVTYNWLKFMVNVGKYTSSMDPMGWFPLFVETTSSWGSAATVTSEVLRLGRAGSASALRVSDAFKLIAVTLGCGDAKGAFCLPGTQMTLVLM